MEFDQAYNHGAVDWNFPSPTATPTSATFNHPPNACQTPKTSTFPSHFHDAFATPQMQGFGTPGPFDHPSMTPLQRPQTSSETLRASYGANVHASGVGVPGQAQYMPLHSQGTLHVPSGTPTLPSNAPPLPSQPAVALSFDSSQMQTPPPTRGTSTKKASSSQLIAFGTPSTIASRRFQTPQQHQQIVPRPPASASQNTPIQFPQLHFPPGGYQFENFGPASAPVFPQTQILWDSPDLFHHQHHQPNPLDDPFAPSMAGEMPWPSASPAARTAPAASFETPEMRSFSTQAPLPRLAPAVLPSNASISQPPPSTMASAGVNPSLVYSSPVRPLEQPKSRVKSTRAHASSEELRRRAGANADHARSETLSSVDSATSSSSRGLRRSHTAGTAELMKAQDSLRVPDVPARNAALQIPRTLSPQKRIGRSLLGSISEKKKLRPRSSIVLTVDENGRARTETRPVDDSPTRSIRARYPGLFDSDSSDAESEEVEQPLSRSVSFSFSRGDERKLKAARLDPPVENLEGLTIPRTSSFNSLRVSPSKAALAAAAQLRREGSVRKRTPSRNNQRRAINPATLPTENNSVDPALGSNVAMNDVDGSRRWSMASLEQAQRHLSVSSHHQLSSTDLIHPGSFHPSTPLIRCVCGITTDDARPLIQCHSCAQWTHVTCVGPNSNAPSRTFVCFFCTKPASGIQHPKARGR